MQWNFSYLWSWLSSFSLRLSSWLSSLLGGGQGIGRLIGRDSNSSSPQLSNSSQSLPTRLGQAGTQGGGMMGSREMESQAIQVEINVRDAVPGDIAGLLEVEEGVEEYETSWTGREFLARVSQQGVGAPKLIVAELRGVVLGYIYLYPHEKCELLGALVVRREWRRFRSQHPEVGLPCGIGTYLVNAAKWVAKVRGKPRLAAFVREENLGAQLFLRSNGFLCKEVVEGMFEDPPGAAYRFVAKIGEEV